MKFIATKGMIENEASDIFQPFIKYEEYLDILMDEYNNLILEKKEEIKIKMLELFKTKRYYQYKNLGNIENLNKKQQLLYFLVKNNIDISTMDRDGSYDIGTVGLHAYDGGFEVMGVGGEPISYCFKTLKGLKCFLTKRNLIKKCWTENYNYEETCKEIGL